MAKKLKQLNLVTVQDLIHHYPFRHEDYSLISPITQIKEGENVTIIGQIVQIESSYLRYSKRRTIQRAILKDNTGIIPIVWFNQPYLVNTFSQPKRVSVSGKVKKQGRQLQFTSPSFEIIGPADGEVAQQSAQNNLDTGRMVPIYSTTYGVSNNYLRRIINLALTETVGKLREFLPPEIIEKENLVDEREAISQIHFPTNEKDLLKAKKRLAFDELFLVQIKHLYNKHRWKEKQTASSLKNKPKITKKLIQSLPFKLTSCQKTAIKEITDDLQKPVAMNRLLQGDVGSGKTIVAVVAALIAAKNKYQTVLMAPTEILAQQHFTSLKSLLSSFSISVELITGSSKKKPPLQKNSQVFVGTHALIHRYKDFQKIGLVIIDEQHRFGVSQRSKLSEKSDLPDKDLLSPHTLTMTATPIPRTITLTMYGDLDISTLTEMPKGRKKVKTYIVAKPKRQKCYSWIRKQIKDNQVQAFIVCPLVEDSETLDSVKSATSEFEQLKNNVFKTEKMGLIHGKLKSKEKEAVLLKMKKGKTDILVATPVVEVGIDITNANIMLIEAANRFGLAQLHQLRGRVGRGEKQAYCFLFAEKASQKARKRLKAMEQISNGLKLAEIDLEIRGPGEIYGTQQHGFPDFKIASYTNLALTKKARSWAERILTQSPDLDSYPEIKNRLSTLLSENIAPN